MTSIDNQLIDKYFPNLPSTQSELFKQLGPLYLEWNEKINVISRKDIESLYEKHVLHSMAIAKYTNFTDGTKILDVGTGGGFPGIPLAILYPNVQFHLIDSIGKKIKVVSEVAQALGLKNVTAEQKRVEKCKDKYDFIVSRAVTAFPRFVALSRHAVSKKQINAISNGILYLKGGDFGEEIEPFKKNAIITELSEYYSEEFFETKKLIHLVI